VIMKRSAKLRRIATENTAAGILSLLASIAIAAWSARAVMAGNPIGGWAMLTVALVGLAMSIWFALEAIRDFYRSKMEAEIERLRSIRPRP
jgi:hypothetical protein